MTFGVIGIGSCVFCCGFAAFFSDSNWHVLESKQGGFKVNVPASPRSSFKPRLFHTDGKFSIEGARVFGANDEFFVMYKEIEKVPAGKNRDEKVLDDLIAQLERGGISLLNKPVAMDVAGFPGRQFEFQDTRNGGHCIAQAVVADGHLYVLVACGTFGLPDPDEVTHFFSSFAFTDPKILAAAEKRKDGNLPPAPANEDTRPAPGPEPVAAAPNSRPPSLESQRVGKLGNDLGNLSQILVATAGTTARLKHAREQEFAVRGVGRDLAAAGLRVVDGERERVLLGGIGTSLGRIPFDTIERLQARTAIEAKVHALGENLGNTLFETRETAPLPRAKP